MKCSVSHIIKTHFNLLLSSNRCKSVFQHPPVVAFRRSPNLRDLLVTAKLPSNSANPQLPCGSFRCGKNCATCPYISHGLTTYTFFSTGETRPIKFNLTCETKNLIYMIQCNRCNLQYIGETKRRLKDRFNEHRRTIDNPNNKSKRFGGKRGVGSAGCGVWKMRSVENAECGKCEIIKESTSFIFLLKECFMIL